MASDPDPARGKRRLDLRGGELPVADMVVGGFVAGWLQLAPGTCMQDLWLRLKDGGAAAAAEVVISKLAQRASPRTTNQREGAQTKCAPHYNFVRDHKLQFGARHYCARTRVFFRGRLTDARATSPAGAVSIYGCD